MYNFLELAVWGRKSNTYKRLISSKQRTNQQPKSRIVLNEGAMLRLSGKLFKELPRDEAISVLNEIVKCAA